MYTWIDHGLSTSYDGDDILGCLVEPIEIDNVSDHVPITLSMLISVKRVTSHDTHGMSGITNRKHVPPNWCSYEKVLKYQHCLALRLRDIDMRELSVGSGNDARLINSYIDSINEAIHRATVDANCIPRKQFIPKPYWCPRLSVLRDRKRFWWHLWVNNGRPRSGVVWDCWKGVKKLFRQNSRFFVNNLSQRKYMRLNNMFHSHNHAGFWKALKNQKKTPYRSSLKPQDFANHFKKISTDSGMLTDEQQKVISVVKEYSDAKVEQPTIV